MRLLLLLTLFVCAGCVATEETPRFNWPVSGTLVGSYGTTSGGQKNDGIDIAAAKGTPVKAAEGGRVVYAGNEVARMGNLLLIEHPGGYITAYGNNESLAVKRGDVVAKGQAIAKANPTVHFEVRRAGKTLDPMTVLPGLLTGAPNSAPKNADPSTVTIKQDAYATSIEVESDVGERAGDETTIYLLAGSIDKKTGAVRTYVQWGEIYTARDWRFYSRASNNKSEPLEFKEVSRKVSSCSRGSCVYTEMYNIYFTPSQVRQAGSTGLDFKVFGRRGDERVVTVPATLVADFNAKMAEAAKLRGR